MAKNTHRFTAQILVKTVVDIPLAATELAAAVEEAKALTPRDVISVKAGACFSDIEMKPVGIYSSEWL